MRLQSYLTTLASQRIIGMYSKRKMCRISTLNVNSDPITTCFSPVAKKAFIFICICRIRQMNMKACFSTSLFCQTNNNTLMYNVCSWGKIFSVSFCMGVEHIQRYVVLSLRVTFWNSIKIVWGLYEWNHIWDLTST